MKSLVHKSVIPVGLSLLAWILLALCCVQLPAQCPLPAPTGFGGKPESSAEALLPESGLLTDDTYTNLYFGFMFHLPLSIHGHRLVLPLQPPGEHALFAMGFQESRRYGTLVVSAGGNSAEYDQRITPSQAQQSRDQIARSKPGAPKRLDYMPVPFKLKRKDKHDGEVRGTQFTAQMKGYIVRFTVQTNDKAFLERARQSIEAIQIFCTDDAGKFFTPDGKPYVARGTATSGPTIPTAIVDEAIGSHPAERTIPSAKVAGGRIRIPDLDFSYTLPAGWSAIQRPPAPDDEGSGDTLAERLLDLWKSCARTVLDAGVSSNSATKLQLRVLDQACFGFPAPASATDSFASETLARYLEMLGRFGTIKSDRVVESGGRLFSVYEGTLATGPARNLEPRDATVIVVTRYGKLLFAWCWSAPTLSELTQVPSSPAQFGSTTPVAIGPAMVIARTTSRP